MRWLIGLVVGLLLSYFNASRAEVAFVCLFLLLSFVSVDVYNLEKKLTAIKDHSGQSGDTISGRFDAVDQMSAKTLKEAEYIAARMRSLEAEIELLRKHLMPDNRRPWDA